MNLWESGNKNIQHSTDVPISSNQAQVVISSKNGNILDIINAKNTLKNAITRVYLLRHYPYDISTPKKETIVKAYEECLKKRRKLVGIKDKEFENNQRILDLGKQISIISNFDSLDSETKNLYRLILSNPEDTILLFQERNPDEIPGRATITGEDLKRKFPKLHVDYVSLPWSRKDDDIWENDQKMVEEMRWALEKKVHSYLGIYKTVIIVWNRSYSHGFDLLCEDGRDRWQFKSEFLFEKQWYFHFDYTLEMDENGAKRKIIRTGSTQIIISPEYAKNIRDHINSQEAKEVIEGWLPQEIQDEINEYFHQSPSLFRKYLLKDNIPLDLEVFCLANIIKTPVEGDLQVLQEYLLAPARKNTHLPEKIFQIFLRYSSEELKTEILLRECLKWEIPVALQAIVKNEQTEDIFFSCQHLSQTLLASSKTANDIFHHSIDKSIRQGENLISRDFHTFRKRPPEEIKRLEEMAKRDGHEATIDPYEKIPTSFDTLLSSRLPSTLIGYVGDGKSTELARMYNLLRSSPEYIGYTGLFYSEKRNRTEKGKEEWNTIISIIEVEISEISRIFPDKKIVVFFDGIDEFTNPLRTKIVDYLTSIHGKQVGNTSICVIMGSRPVESFEHYGNERIQTIHFDIIPEDEREKFLRSRLQFLEKKKNNKDVSEETLKKLLAKISEFLEKGMLEEHIKNTPLILFFLCDLVSGNKSGKKLSDIENRADLYEEMARNILCEHQGNSNAKNPIVTSGMEGIVFDVLGRCAYEMHMRRMEAGMRARMNETQNPSDTNLNTKTKIGPLSESDILSYLSKAGISSLKTRKAVCNQIFLLYPNEGGEYRFILKSFEEFFLARYLANHPDGSDVIYQMRDTCRDGNDGKWLNWGDWRNFKPVVMFYGQLLGNNAKKEILESAYNGDEERIQGLTPKEIAKCLKNATEQDSESLAKLLSFLGEEGILKNDDIFGEGFFMGLEVMYTVSGWIKFILNWTLNCYLRKMRPWRFHDICMRLELIKNFSRNIWYKDTEVSKRILMECNRFNKSTLKRKPELKPFGAMQLFYETILDIGTPMIIKTYQLHCQKFFNIKKIKECLIVWDSIYEPDRAHYLWEHIDNRFMSKVYTRSFIRYFYNSGLPNIDGLTFDWSNSMSEKYNFPWILKIFNELQNERLKMTKILNIHNNDINSANSINTIKSWFSWNLFMNASKKLRQLWEGRDIVKLYLSAHSTPFYFLNHTVLNQIF